MLTFTLTTFTEATIDDFTGPAVLYFRANHLCTAFELLSGEQLGGTIGLQCNAYADLFSGTSQFSSTEVALGVFELSVIKGFFDPTDSTGVAIGSLGNTTLSTGTITLALELFMTLEYDLVNPTRMTGSIEGVGGFQGFGSATAEPRFFDVDLDACTISL